MGNEIMHFGTKGMRWGFRKNPNRGGARHRPGSPTIKQINKSRIATAKNVARLSNAQLAKKLKRLKQEAELKSYTKQLAHSEAYNFGCNVLTKSASKVLIGGLAAVGSHVVNKYVIPRAVHQIRRLGGRS